MLTPKTEAELAQMIAEADMPLRVQGGGTRPVGTPTNGDALTTSGMTGIELYEPGALTMVVRTGTPLSEVERALDAEGQRLAFEPMDHRPLLGTSGTPTIGGVVAANVSGPRRIQVGACRDHVLGVRFVDGQGNIIKNGGRVMKNVTGYDLVKLMTGSFGTLGVLTEVSLKTLPKSHFTGTLSLEGLSAETAVRALSVALGSPYEVTGAAHVVATETNAARTLIRLEGFENSVAYRADAMQKALSEFGKFDLETDPATTEGTWRDIRDVAPYVGADGDVWKVSVKPSDGPELVDELSRTGTLRNAVLDWGGGLVWLEVETGQDVRPSNLAGHATLIRCARPAEKPFPTFQPLPPAVAALQSGLRQKFDPRAILNPGLMGHAA